MRVEIRPVREHVRWFPAPRGPTRFRCSSTFQRCVGRCRTSTCLPGCGAATGLGPRIFIGVLVGIVGLTLIGFLGANLLGRSLISGGEMVLDRMPIVRNVYRALKQIFESIVTATESKRA
ncbi:MAG: DUF502 domain-containing protein, partial [Deltaproteobacteria bacterium]|nr:DUF502 domain-containing protein [Deltaproteobacteria bacterium]